MLTYSIDEVRPKEEGGYQKVLRLEMVQNFKVKAPPSPSVE
jgi:hypothetical protein